MKRPRCAFLAGLVTLAACIDAPAGVTALGDPALAKGAEPAKEAVDFTITDTGMDVTSDGKGIYRNGICGVVGKLQSDILYMAPAGANLPKKGCSGPRAATLVLSLRHVSDSPHIDEPLSATSYAVVDIKFGFGPGLVTVVNSSATCGGQGLRFAPNGYPGSDFTVRDDLGGGLWHLYTRPWPDNRAYCEINGAPAFWHVSLDLHVQVLGS